MLELLGQSPGLPTHSIVETPVIQWGFAGFCILLLLKNYWLSRTLIALVQENDKVILNNTAVIETLSRQLVENQHTMTELREKMLSRPCLIDK